MKHHPSLALAAQDSVNVYGGLDVGAYSNQLSGRDPDQDVDERHPERPIGRHRSAWPTTSRS